jgi:3-methylcrotonyl-CoA carboxylase beta subunit
MPLHSTINPASSDFARNAEAMRTLVAELRQKLDEVAGGGGKVSRARILRGARCWRVNASIF